MSYNYYSNYTKAATKLFKQIQKIDRNKTSGQISWAELYFNGNVPKIKSKPTLEQFELPNNAKELIEKEKAEKIDKIDRENSVKQKVILSLFVIPTIAFINWAYNEGGLALVCMLSLFYFGIVAVIYSMIEGRFFRKTSEVTSQYDLAYKQYEDSMLAYEYWQNLKSVKYWDKLDGHSFERKVADLYEKYGYETVVSKAGGDGGIDIILTKGASRIAVQCKAHNKAVAPAVARDLYGTMVSAGFEKGMIISKNGFTKGVYDFVKDKKIELVDMDNLIKMASDLLMQ